MLKRSQRPPPKVIEYILWQQKYGKDSGSTGVSDSAFLQKMREDNPEQFVSKPELDPPEITILDREYIEAFYMLTSSRQSGMGIGAIPLSEIFGYADRHYSDEDEYDAFVSIIQSADSAYMSAGHEEQERKVKK